MTPIRTTLSAVEKYFRYWSKHGPSGTGEDGVHFLKEVADEINNLLIDDEISNEVLKQKTDLIIAGAIIYAMIFIDTINNNPKRDFCDSYIYPRIPSEVRKSFPEGIYKTLDIVNHLGHRALIDRDLPFTGVFDKNFGCGKFVALNDLLKDHFKSYPLDIDPKTMNPDELNKPGKEKRAQAKEIAKWKKPFGISHHITDKRAKSEISVSENWYMEFPKRRNAIFRAIRDQKLSYDNALWNWRCLVVLACVLAPLSLLTCFITVPWLKNKRAEIESERDDRTWVWTSFTRKEYDEIRAQRLALKATFTEKTDLRHQKPLRVCAGVDKQGKTTEKMEDITEVRMYCDKEQLRRWSPRFLATATQATYNKSVQESVRLKSSSDLFYISAL